MALIKQKLNGLGGTMFVTNFVLQIKFIKWHTNHQYTTMIVGTKITWVPPSFSKQQIIPYICNIDLIKKVF